MSSLIKGTSKLEMLFNLNILNFTLSAVNKNVSYAEDTHNYEYFKSTYTYIPPLVLLFHTSDRLPKEYKEVMNKCNLDVLKFSNLGDIDIDHKVGDTQWEPMQYLYKPGFSQFIAKASSFLSSLSNMISKSKLHLKFTSF
jgi:hypothetical protein